MSEQQAEDVIKAIWLKALQKARALGLDDVADTIDDGLARDSHVRKPEPQS